MSDNKHHAEEAAIRALDKEWSKVAHAKDIDRVIAFYATDATVLWPANPIARGHAQIRKVWQAAYQSTPDLYVEFHPTHIEISSGGDMACDFGVVCFAPHVKPDDIENVGKYLVVWQRQHGTWKVLCDSYNMNGTNSPVKQ
jgi:ketosteroid isomerase-like protein